MAKQQLSFNGTWRILVPDHVLCDDDGGRLIDDGKGLIAFGENRHGTIEFGNVHGQIDYRTACRGGKPAVEFTWQDRMQKSGPDDEDEVMQLSGRGWVILEDNKLTGVIYTHNGIDSEFEATRVGTRKTVD